VKEIGWKVVGLIYVAKVGGLLWVR